MIIHAMSRARALRLRPNATCALISISTPGKLYFTEPRAEGWLGFLALVVDDVANEVPEHLALPGDWLATSFSRFSEADAIEVATRVRLWQSLGCEDLVIHCDAGLSRSVGVGEALWRAGVGELRLWECEQPLQANPLVLTRMRDALATVP